MHVISEKKLRQFWTDPKNLGSEKPLRAWYQVVSTAEWRTFADVCATDNSVDQVGSKTVFNVGGNNYGVIAVIDFVGQKVFIRYVLDDKDYDKGKWQDDSFRWQKKTPPTGQRRKKNRKPKRRGRE